MFMGIVLLFCIIQVVYIWYTLGSLNWLTPMSNKNCTMVYPSLASIGLLIFLLKDGNSTVQLIKFISQILGTVVCNIPQVSLDLLIWGNVVFQPE